MADFLFLNFCLIPFSIQFVHREKSSFYFGGNSYGDGIYPGPSGEIPIFLFIWNPEGYFPAMESLHKGKL
jgi:hypothetical protein